MEARFFEPMYEIMLIARPLRNMFLADHIGCAVRVRNQVTVHHIMDDGSILQSSWDEFADGKSVRVLERAPLNPIAFNSRLLSTKQEPWLYDLIMRNCEHYARFLFGGKATSHQIILVGTLAAVLIAWRLLRK